MKRELTQELLRELFDYRADGLFIRKTRPNGRVQIGDVAGRLHKSTGRFRLMVNGCNLALHRAVYMWHHGYIPRFIDHIDGDAGNNRIENLRECTLSQNQKNRPGNKNSSSVCKGVSYVKKNRNWAAKCTTNKGHLWLGVFDTEIEAARVSDMAMREHHGEFARLNFTYN